MESNPGGGVQLGAAAKRLALRLATIGENRVELLAVEIQEARERLLCALLLALGVAVFGLLAALAFTAAIVICLWTWSHVAVLMGLTVVYAAAGIWLYRRLSALIRHWHTLPASLDQIHKDLAGLKDLLK